MIIELRATRIGLHCEVEWCKPKEATQFSVYIGVPGAFRWAADFAEHDAASAWANYIARSRGAEFIDYVKEEQHG